ncbi:MAG TPA: hypothetical protein VNL36_11035 [Bacteroidota bacterium]|nr:hypothetical protein [Bacteroidota bacterium]
MTRKQTSHALIVVHLFVLLMLSFSISACDLINSLIEKDEEPEETGPTAPIVPQSFAGRPVQVQGTAYVKNYNVTLRVWDSETIDGDIISLAVNGQWVLQNYTLTGTKYNVPVVLNRSGYSYILLYAHNEGSISPNTAAVSLWDGVSEQTLVLSANLRTNGAYNVVVQR